MLEGDHTIKKKQMEHTEDGMDCGVPGHGAVLNWAVKVGPTEEEMSEQRLVG